MLTEFGGRSARLQRKKPGRQAAHFADGVTAAHVVTSVAGVSRFP